MISANVCGNIAAEPKQRMAGTVPALSLRVASNGFSRGEKKTDWIDIDLVGERFIKLLPHLVKGKSIAVTGVLTLREYTTKDGEKRNVLDLKGFDLEFTGSGPGNGKTEPVISDADETGAPSF